MTHGAVAVFCFCSTLKQKKNGFLKLIAATMSIMAIW